MYCEDQKFLSIVSTLQVYTFYCFSIIFWIFSINFCYCNFVVSLLSIDNIWFRKPIFFSITCTRRWQLRKPLPWTYSEIKSFEENSIEFFLLETLVCKTILIIISPLFIPNKSCSRIRFLWNTIKSSTPRFVETFLVQTPKLNSQLLYMYM